MNKKMNEIKIFKTRKYKNIDLYLRFSIPYRKNEKALAAILAKLLGQASSNYPDKVSMTRAKDLLYGIDVLASSKSRADIVSFNVHYSFINPRFLDGITIDDYLSFIKETLCSCLIRNKDVKEAKRNICDSLKRRMDKPQVLANERVVELISEDNDDFAIYGSGKGFIAQIQKVKLQEIKDFYAYLLDKAQLNIYLSGDIDDELAKRFAFLSLDKREEVKVGNLFHEYRDQGEIIERKKISQSYLSLVYATPYSKKHQDFFAWILGNVFLGVVPTSLLFEEIREKLSLCYAISVHDFKNEGLVKIYTDIDGRNKDIVIAKINEQLRRLREMDYETEKLEIAKALFINSIMSSYDDLDILIDYYEESYLSDFEYSLEEYCEKLNEVSKEDIARVFENYRHVLTYMLEGSENG